MEKIIQSPHKGFGFYVIWICVSVRTNLVKPPSIVRFPLLSIFDFFLPKVTVGHFRARSTSLLFSCFALCDLVCCNELHLFCTLMQPLATCWDYNIRVDHLQRLDCAKVHPLSLIYTASIYATGSGLIARMSPRIRSDFGMNPLNMLVTRGESNASSHRDGCMYGIAKISVQSIRSLFQEHLRPVL